MLKKLLLAGLAMSLALTGNAWADRDDDDDDDDRGSGSSYASVAGEVVAINGTSRPSITIETSSGRTVRLAVSGRTDIEIDGEDVTLADLEVGDLVEAKYDRRSGLAVKIEAEDDVDELEARGIFRGFSGASDTEVVIELANGDELLLDLSNDTEVKFGPFRLNPATETDLLVGLPVKVEYDPATGEVLELEAETSLAELLIGDVVDVDADAGLLTLETSEGEVEILVPEDLRVLRNGRPVSLSALVEGDRVKVLALMTETGTEGTALKVELLSNLFKTNGRVVAVSDTSITVLVRGRQMTFELGPNARVTLNNRSVSLADIAAALNQGRKVEAQITYRDRLLDTDLAVEVKANANQVGKGKDKDKDKSKGKGKGK